MCLAGGRACCDQGQIYAADDFSQKTQAQEPIMKVSKRANPGTAKEPLKHFLPVSIVLRVPGEGLIYLGAW